MLLQLDLVEQSLSQSYLSCRMESASGKGINLDDRTGSIRCHSRYRQPWMQDSWNMYPTTRKYSKLPYGSEKFEKRLQCPLLFSRILSLTGWSDIGYSFLISENGWIYEGRGWTRVGSHRSGYNNRSIGKTYISDRFCAFLKMYFQVLLSSEITNRSEPANRWLVH